MRSEWEEVIVFYSVYSVLFILLTPGVGLERKCIRVNKGGVRREEGGGEVGSG